jgi:HD superfamily phosphohydrolase
VTTLSPALSLSLLTIAFFIDRKYEENRFMFDIVANKRNSVDVDKFDYLARDCYMCGIKSSYDFSR